MPTYEFTFLRFAGLLNPEPTPTLNPDRLVEQLRLYGRFGWYPAQAQPDPSLGLLLEREGAPGAEFNPTTQHSRPDGDAPPPPADLVPGTDDLADAARNLTDFFTESSMVYSPELRRLIDAVKHELPSPPEPSNPTQQAATRVREFLTSFPSTYRSDLTYVLEHQGWRRRYASDSPVLRADDLELLLRTVEEYL